METYFSETLIYFGLFLIMSIAILIYGFNPKVKMIKAGGKLAQPEFASIRKKVELVVRGLLFLLALSILAVVVRPLAYDIYGLYKGSPPITVSGKVTYFSAFGSNPYLKQTVMLNGETNTENAYTIVLSKDILRMGDSFKLKVLPNSHMIVVVKKLNSAQ